MNKNHFPIKLMSTQTYRLDKINHIYCTTIKYVPKELPKYFYLEPETHYKPLEIFSSNKLEDYMDERIKFCPDCINIGYHSYLHQLRCANRCFWHSKELIHTSIPYCVNNLSYYNMPIYYKILHKEVCWKEILERNIPPSRQLLLGLLEKDCLVPQLPSFDISQINIICLPPKSVGVHSSKEALYEYLRTIFGFSKSCNHGRILLSIDKDTAEEKWVNYAYKDSILCYIPSANEKTNRSWFFNYCHDFSKSLYDNYDRNLIEKTLIDFRSSYAAWMMMGRLYDYDPTSISIILTCAILTGYFHTESQKSVFSNEWRNNSRICLLENEFTDKIRFARKKYQKTVYLELYKIIVDKVYITIKEIAISGLFAHKDYYQTEAIIRNYNNNTVLQTQIMEFPIYLIIEKGDRIEIVEVI